MVKKSDEIQNYILQITERRKREGCFDYEDCQAILAHAAELNSDAISGIGYYYFAEYYWFLRDNEKTMYCLGECTKCFQAAGMYEFLARGFNMMGAVSDTQGNQVVALNYYYTGLQYAERYHLPYAYAMLSTNIGHILMEMRRYEEAARRYEQAVTYYKRSEDNVRHTYNLVLSSVYCGSCYLKLHQNEKAYAIWDKVTKLRRDFPDRVLPGINIQVFEAECEAAKESGDRFFKCMDGILDYLCSLDDIFEAGDCLTAIAELLLKAGDYDRLDKFFSVIDARGLEKQLMLNMNLYPYRSSFLLHQERTEEYLQHTRRYFAFYEKDRQNNRQVTARIMELRDKLSSMEKEREKMRACNRQLKDIALYDSMTNLANRTFLNEYASARFEDAQREKKLLGVELLDIDYFKNYNDAYGHLAGDACIEAVAGVLRKIRSDKVFCGRYGGDEFMIVYNDLSLEEISRVVDKIQQRVRELAIPHEASECSDIITVSQGIFVREPEEQNREWDFNSQADKILYRAKRSGRNRYRIETAFME